MTDRLDFETRLEERLRARADLAARPFDATAIARQAVAAAGPLRRIGTLPWPSMRPALGWLVVGLLLAMALLAAVTLGGALLRQRPPVLRSDASNGWVAFAVQEGTRHGGSDIYLVKNGVEQRRIIGTGGDGLRQVCPSFSPDGTRLAYSEAPVTLSGAIPSVPGAVVIITLDDAGLPVGPVLRLPAPSVGDVCPKWAPDGQTVAFLANEQQPQLWIGRLDGTETRVDGGEAIGFDGFAGQFDWSPDGTAVVAVGDQSSSIWIVPIDGRPGRLLSRASPAAGPTGPSSTPSPTPASAADFEEPRWSPDRTRIAVVTTSYVGDPSVGLTAVGSSVQVYRADGSGSPIDLAGGHDLTWSPDGRRLAYVRTRQRDGLEQDEVVSVAPEADDVRVVANEPRVIRGLMWSPDGMRLLYVADDSTVGSGGLVSVSAVGDSGPIVLTQPGGLEFTGSESISWQPVFP